MPRWRPRTRQVTEQVFVVVYPDPQDIAGLGVAYLENADEAAAFAVALPVSTP